MPFEIKSSAACFGGKLIKLSHESRSTSTPMSVNVFLPPQVSSSSTSASSSSLSGKKVPVLFFLAGLTCNEDNAAVKGFLQPAAAKHGIAVVYPDTSPRGLEIKGQDDAYDFGTGAGFYLNATAAPWDKNYRMYDYVSQELPSELAQHFSELDFTRMSLSGHSMGGHGALTIFLKNPGKYRSVSAFAPIANPSQCPWGQKAFSGYLGDENKAQWSQWDATELVRKRKEPLEALIDVGTGDDYYKQGQLLPENFAAAAKEAGMDSGLRIRYLSEYDHSYYFVSTFVEEHIAYAAQHLKA